jgi:Kef-type K+ transport system membrane component KefB
MFTLPQARAGAPRPPRALVALLCALLFAGSWSVWAPPAVAEDVGPSPDIPNTVDPAPDTVSAPDATPDGDALLRTDGDALLRTDGDTTPNGDALPGTDTSTGTDTTTGADTTAPAADAPLWSESPPPEPEPQTVCLDSDPPIVAPEPVAPPAPDTPKPTEIVPKPPERQPITPGEAIKAILGLLILLTLAYIAGHPRVVRLEQRLRISQVITAGFPFVLFGLAAHSEGVGILSDPILDEIRPILPIGLGWIGFVVGFRFDLRKIENLPDGVGSALLLTTVLPFLAVVGMTSLLFGLLEGVDDSSFLRDAILLATAGAMTARTVPGLISTRGAEPAIVDRVSRIIKLEEVIAFVALVMVAAFFRPDNELVGWRVPAVGWVFITLGVGTILGGLVFALMRSVHGGTETLVVTLGSIAFAAGMASYLKLSPIVVCFLAGALVSNLPGTWKEQVGTALSRLERPIYLVFLVIAGAYWKVDEWQGWVLMLLFVATRLFSRFIGVRLFTGQHPDALSPVEQRNLAASPMGALSIAIIINAQDLYSGQTLPWIVHAIIGGSLLTEIVVQVFALGRDVATLTPLAPLRPRTVTAMAAVAGPPTGPSPRPDPLPTPAHEPTPTPTPAPTPTPEPTPPAEDPK